MTQVFFTKYAEEQMRKMPEFDRLAVFDVLDEAASNSSFGKPVFTTVGEPVRTATGVASSSHLIFEVRKNRWHILFTRRASDIIVLTVIRDHEDARTRLQEVLTSVVTEVTSAAS